MTNVFSRIVALFMSLISTITLFFSALSGGNPSDKLKAYLGGGRMKISDVEYVSDAVYFTADGASCVLQFTSPHGWRLRTAKPDGTFDDYGAGQALSRDLGEESPDRIETFSASGNNTFTASDGSTAQLKNGKGVVINTPSGKQAYNVDVIHTDSDGKLHVAGNLDLTEKLYGTGERYDYLNQRGNRVEVYARDCWAVTNSKSYLQIPIITSSRGCGLFMNRNEHMMIDLGSTSRNRFDFELSAGTCDLYIFPTEQISDVLYGYSAISGFSPVPADWMYGTLVCRHAPEFTSKEGIYALVDNMAANDFPLDGVILEGYDAWNRGKWTELKEIADYLHSKGIKCMVYANCDSPDSPYGLQDSYLVHDATGSSWISQIDAYKDYGVLTTKGDRRYVDLTNADARQWYANEMWGQLITNCGVDGAKIDFCELIPDDARTDRSTLVFSDGRATQGAHHWLPVVANTIAYKQLSSLNGAGGTTVTRGGGIGSQRYPIIWTGDQKREFKFLKSMLRGWLSAGLSGVPFITSDMSGYYLSDNDILNPESEVFIRGLQYTCFSSTIQTHGHSNVSRPYDFDDATKNLYRIYANMHEALRPYLVEMGEIASGTALPITRALILYDQNDSNCADIWDEYMFGDAFLVAPVLDGSKSFRDIYLPKGSWTDIYTGKVYEGGKTLRLFSAPLSKIPVFINNNSKSETLPETLRAIQPYIDEINALG
ncbi:MAG: hypothetical protein K6G90_09695 [Clostridia bacterium]|nr:hypothetical protein [Clostridia bacterium]